MNKSTPVVLFSSRVLALLIGLTACGGDTTIPDAPSTPTVRVARIDVTPDSSGITIGQSVTLTATPRDSAGNALPGSEYFVAWTGNEPAGTFRSSVSGNQLTLSALVSARATIFASLGRISGTALVLVQ